MIEIFKASVLNVRELKEQRKNLNRFVNQSIKHNENASFAALTKLYALLYSSFAEVCFLKIIHTPYGFSDDYINQISSQRNLDQKWLKCLELAFSRVNQIGNAGEIQNKKKTLTQYILKYVIEPSQLRNKIAHGQWKAALNSENTAINQATTDKINNLDFVKIDILFTVYEKISQAVEDLIESPHRAHFNSFYNHMSELETFVSETENWNLKSKILALKSKFDRIKSKKGI